MSIMHYLYVYIHLSDHRVNLFKDGREKGRCMGVRWLGSDKEKNGRQSQTYMHIAKTNNRINRNQENDKIRELVKESTGESNEAECTHRCRQYV